MLDKIAGSSTFFQVGGIKKYEKNNTIYRLKALILPDIKTPFSKFCDPILIGLYVNFVFADRLNQTKP